MKRIVQCWDIFFYFINFRKMLRWIKEAKFKLYFRYLQAWLDRYGPFDAVIDGANIGLNNQYKFSFFQVMVFHMKCCVVLPSGSQWSEILARIWYLILFIAYVYYLQLNNTVNGLRQMSLSEKLPLVVLHCNRVRGGPADNPNNKRLLESWRRAGALYTTPPGSNDDW